VLSDGVAAAVIAAARAAGKPVVVDPKGIDYAPYRGATVLKPNRRELALATGMRVGTPAEIVAAAKRLIATCEFGAVLVSLSQDGMILVEASGAVHELPALAHEVFDVSGAGDTAIATLAAAIAVGLDRHDAAALANLAAGIIVGKTGTVPITQAELLDALGRGEQHATVPLGQKVTEPKALEEIVERWRSDGESIGFTNGCFDLLHAGHVSYLDWARRHCDRLVVGLNTDASVRELKGEGRPLNPEAARAAVLAGLAAVDAIVLFDDSTPLHLIKALRPDVLVKGSDYAERDIVGAPEVRSWGGRVLRAPVLEGYSTSDMLDRITPTD
jgi:D-beta-D-heptose 7-phosphate kinase / D-beta-D-heptose 1-phosphate adenosyltransferase